MHRKFSSDSPRLISDWRAWIDGANNIMSSAYRNIPVQLLPFYIQYFWLKPDCLLPTRPRRWLLRRFDEAADNHCQWISFANDDDGSTANRHLTTPVTRQRRPIVALSLSPVSRPLPRSLVRPSVRPSISVIVGRLAALIARLRLTHENRSADGTTRARPRGMYDICPHPALSDIYCRGHLLSRT